MTRRARVFASVLLLLATGCAPMRAFKKFPSRTWTALTTPTRPAPVHVGQPYRRDARLAVLWVGHATTLIQLGDKVVLTDPVFTERVGGLSPRLVEPGVTVHELPPIDVALVSHMHFDHLSFDSLRMIASRTRTLLLPAGGRNYIHEYSFDEVELPTWSSWESDGLRVTAVPVKHVGWRWIIDALWNPKSFTGYVIEHDGVTVFFGGDTALDEDAFRAIAARFPKIDLALVPIAPVEPRAFMKRTHMDGVEAARAIELLNPRVVVPIHYDTFINSSDEPGDAMKVFTAALASKPGLPERVQALQIGEQRVLERR